MSVCCRNKIAFLLLAASALLAQSERASISGTVHDASGAVVSDAKITAVETATNSSTTVTTNGVGDYTIPNLAVGIYNVRVERDGFRPAQVAHLTLNAAMNARVDVTLEIGATKQAVEVQAAAAQLQTEDAKSGSTVTNKMVDELPLVVGGTIRSPFDLAALTPETRAVGGDAGFTLGGGQGASYSVTLDGVSANTGREEATGRVNSNAPSLESVTEFTVDTNGFKAEYGHAGGGVMTFVSKSGTNDLHGSAYEFLRNSDFDANYFFSNRAGIPIPIYKQNDFGGSVGGPVLIPKLYHGRNKTFFFFAYEGFRNRAGATAVTTTIPTPEMYNGDFSKWVNAAGQTIPIYDPTTQVIGANGSVTRTPFPNNQIPKSSFDPLAVQALSVFASGPGGQLQPNTGALPGTVGYVNNNYIISKGSNVSPINKWNLKGDHMFSSKDRVSAYYGRDREATVPGPDGPLTLPGYYSNNNDLHQDADVSRLSWDHIFSPTKFNHFFAGANVWSSNKNPTQEYIGNWKSKFCLPNVPDCNQNLINFTFSNGYGGWGGQANNGAEQPLYSYNDDFTWIHGKHAFKFGGMFQLTHYDGFGRQCISGCATFNFAETGRGGDTNFATAGGNPFASLLLGWADNGQLDTVRFIGQHWPYFAGYFQDDWRVSRKLTLNLGLRWETQLPPVGLNDQWSDFSPTTPNPAAGNIPGAVIFAGSGPGRQGSSTLADSYYKAFGPRLGFAYSLNDKTTIRGGYARSFGAIVTTTGSAHNMGFTLTQTFPNSSNGVQPSFLLKSGLPPWTAPPFIDPSVSNGTSVTWWQGRESARPPEDNNVTLSIQRQLSSSMVLEASYNGVIGSHLQAGLLNYNQLNPAYLNQYSSALLNSAVTSPAAMAAGITAPFPGFVQLWGSRATVAQALRPFPQYTTIDTAAGGGDHSGHSSYHAAVVKFQKRYASGLTFQTSYVFSKLLTDADSYFPGIAAADQFNRRLEKSIGQYDVTHNFKLALVYELPFGKGKAWMTRGLAAMILGNWRVSTINVYQSGTPIGISSTASLPIFAGRTRHTSPLMTAGSRVGAAASILASTIS
jgi:Carboxypeptidase regulatory-like domain